MMSPFEFKDERNLQKLLWNCFTILFLFGNLALAQPVTKTVSGFLVNEMRVPLSGVKIKLKDQPSFLQTDSVGYFQIFYEPTSEGDSVLSLDIEYSNYKYSEIKLISNPTYLIKVENDPVLEKYNSPYTLPADKEIIPNNIHTVQVREALPPKVHPMVKKMEGIIVRTYFATDRRQVNGNEKGPNFDGKRSEVLKFGYCDVSIPDDHKIGELESPTWWKFEFSEDQNKHVMILSTKVTGKNDFFKLSNNGLATSGKNAFVFIHGYNVSFSDAARRTAQIAYDLKFDGLPVFYSWPSNAKKSGYKTDEGNIEWTQAHLEAFLTEFLKTSKAEKVYIIAHSMGNRAMTRVLSSVLNKFPAYRKKIKEVILAAPDIDAAVFKTQIAPPLINQKINITLYASSKDLALNISEALSAYPRAGQSGKGLVVLKGIETIDVSKLTTDLLGHSYFASTRTVLTDWAYLIKQGLRPYQREGLKKIPFKGYYYWLFEK